MANPNEGQGGPVLPWLCELLLEVYLQLLQYCLPPLRTHSQDPAVGLGSAKQEAFDALKEAVTSTPILTFPSQSSCFHLKCNTSNFATGAVLSQAQADGMHQPITFMSKGFSDAERNYQIHNKEMLAIMHALDKWHHFLEGAMEKFKILMDHQNLAYF